MRPCLEIRTKAARNGAGRLWWFNHQATYGCPCRRYATQSAKQGNGWLSETGTYFITLCFDRRNEKIAKRVHIIFTAY